MFGETEQFSTFFQRLSKYDLLYTNHNYEVLRGKK